jgi:hypothetical protein
MYVLALVLSLFPAQTDAVSSAPIVVANVCDLFNRRTELHGKQVRIRGHLQYNVHGLFLYPEKDESKCESIVIGFASRPPKKGELQVEYSGEFPDPDTGRRCKKLSIKAPPLVEDAEWIKFKKLSNDASTSTWIEKARAKCSGSQICEVTVPTNIHATVNGFVYSADRSGQKCTGFSESNGFRVLLVVQRFRDVTAETVVRKVQIAKRN